MAFGSLSVVYLGLQLFSTREMVPHSLAKFRGEWDLGFYRHPWR